jgi:hypothetical protein
MNAPLIVTAVLAALLVHPAQEEVPRPLERVQRAPGEPHDPQASDAQSGKELHPAVWIERLSAPDLEQREKNFGNLVRRAQNDQAARAFLEELSRDANRPELAWTARLALRELARRPSPFDWVPEGPGMEDSMQRMLEDVMGHFPAQPLVLRGLPGAGRSVQVQQGPEGAKVVITETIEGQETKREFAGRDLQEILEQNPELAQEINLSVDGAADGFRLQWHDAPTWQELVDPFASPSKKSQALRTDVLGVIVSALPAARAQELGVASGLVVHTVSRGTIASLLQVRAGDTLLELNGRPLARAQDITEALADRPADGALSLVWIDQLGQRINKTWRPDGAK